MKLINRRKLSKSRCQHKRKVKKFSNCLRTYSGYYLMVLIGCVNIKQWHECLTERGNDKSSHFTTIFHKNEKRYTKILCKKCKKDKWFFSKNQRLCEILRIVKSIFLLLKKGTFRWIGTILKSFHGKFDCDVENFEILKQDIRLSE